MGTLLWFMATDIPTSVVAGKNILDLILEKLRAEKWAESSLFGVHLALEEAIVNAMKHGNRLDSSKTVTVEVKLTTTTFEVTITDEGAGFDLALVPDCTAKENLEVPGGRGIKLMNGFMDQVSYNGPGNSVTMAVGRGGKASLALTS